MGSQISSAGSGGGTGTGSPIRFIVTDSGTASPSGGIVNIVGGSNITTTEAGNTAVISLDSDISITRFNAGDLSIYGNKITVPTNTDVIFNRPLKISYLNPSSILYLGPSYEFSDTGSMTDGQLMIGVTGGAPVAANLTAGDGISITNGPNSVTIAATGSGYNILDWEMYTYTGAAGETSQYTMEAGKGYIGNNCAAYRKGSADGPIEYKHLLFNMPLSSTLSAGNMFAAISTGGAPIAIRPQPDQVVLYYRYSGSGTQDVTTGDGAPIQYPQIITPAGANIAGLTQGEEQTQAIWFLTLGNDFPEYSGKMVIQIFKTQIYWVAGLDLKLGPIT